MTAEQERDFKLLGNWGLWKKADVRRSGQGALDRLSAQMDERGFGWLDGWMEQMDNAVADSSRTPFVNMLKTPSRTTARKTRAGENAATERAQKIASVNSKMVGSPMSKSNSSRMPLSPLGARSLNTSNLPSLGLSPAGSKGKPTKQSAAEKTSSKPSRAVKGKGKKMIEVQKEVPTIHETLDVDMETSAAEKSSGTSEELSSGTTSASRNETGDEGGRQEDKSSPSEPSVAGPSTTSQNKPVSEPVEPASVSAPTRSAPQPTVDLSIITEGDEDKTMASTRSRGAAGPSTKATEARGMHVHREEETEAGPELKEAILDADQMVVDDNEPTEPEPDMDMEEEEEVEPAQPAPQPLPTRQVRSSWLSKALGTGTVSQQTGHAQSTQQQHQRGSDGSRSSFATSSTNPNPRHTQFDYGNFRKSLVQPGSLKRKSDVAGVDGEENKEEERKAEKFSKVETPSITTAVNAVPSSSASQHQSTQSQPQPQPPTSHAAVDQIAKSAFERQKSHDIFGRVPNAMTNAGNSASKAGLSATTNTFIGETQSVPLRDHTTSTSAEPDLPRGGRGRSDIHTVAKKLDEMREKQLAKEAAKKAALASSSGHKSAQTPSSSHANANVNTDTIAATSTSSTGSGTGAGTSTGTSTGTGFLRGLGSSLGRSLGIGLTARSAEEQGKKLERELAEEEAEAERRAQEDLNAIMRGMNASPADVKEELAGAKLKAKIDGIDIDGDVAVDVGGSKERENQLKSPVPVSRDRAQDDPKSPEQVEEEEDEAEVFATIDDVSPVKSKSQSAPTDKASAASAPTPAVAAPAPAPEPIVNAAPTGSTTPIVSPRTARYNLRSPTQAGMIPLAFSPIRSRPPMLSTTPQGTPRGPAAAASGVRNEAPAIGGRAEKHGLPSPSKHIGSKAASASAVQEKVKMFESKSPERAASALGKVAPAALAFRPQTAQERDTAHADVDMDMEVAANDQADTDPEEDEQEYDEQEEEEEEEEQIEEREPRTAASQTQVQRKPTNAPMSASTTQKGKSALPSRPASQASGALGIKKSTSNSSIATTATGRTTNSAMGMSVMSSATLHANKSMGVKPSVAPPKSLQLSQNAKKANAAMERRNAIAEEKRKAKEREAEVQRNDQLAAKRIEKEEHENRTKEIAERKKRVAEEKRAREEQAEKEREKVEADKKRKLAASAKFNASTSKTLAASTGGQGQGHAHGHGPSGQPAAKRHMTTAPSTAAGGAGGLVPMVKMPAGLTRPTNPSQGPTGSSTMSKNGMVAAQAAAKLGPTSFRTAATGTTASTVHAVSKQAPAVVPETPAHQISHGPMRLQNGTISLVGAGNGAVVNNNNNQHRPMPGQAYRPSQQPLHQHQHQHQQNGAFRPSTAIPHPPAGSSTNTNIANPANPILAQSRLALHAQLEAANYQHQQQQQYNQQPEIAPEDVDLPDIASEYSDSEDESDGDSPAFKRPSWAESPELREALRRQANRDPDELFGPIKPLVMEELFKAPKGKFRHRTSSANWSKDGLTRGEEEEYARRMGFSSAPQPLGQGR